MATSSWEGFKPDMSEGTPPKKSPQEQLDEIDDQMTALEERRKELLFEVAKEEAAEDEEVHKDCASKDELREAEEEADENYEAWEHLRQFGGHAPPCLQGALAGTQALHPLCTCGWNEVATHLERRTT
jgi:hypothetical protein